MDLTARQKQILNNIKDSEDTVFYLKGSGGTGKTLTASALVRDGKFKNILIVAPTATALSVIRRKIGIVPDINIDFKTLASLIKSPVDYLVSNNQTLTYRTNKAGIRDLTNFLSKIKVEVSDLIKLVQNYNKAKEDKYLIDVEKLNKRMEKSIMKNVKFEIETRFLYIPTELINLENKKGYGYDLILVDEASMVNSEDAKKLNNAVKGIGEDGEKNLFRLKFKRKIVWVGDEKQLPPVEGKLPREFKTNNTNLLTDVLRSNDHVIKMATIVSHGGIEAIKEMDRAESLDRYLADNIGKISKYDVCLAFTNKHVDMINKKLRALHTDVQSLTVGEPIVVTKNAGYTKDGILFNNSQRLIVNEIYSRDDTLDLIQGTYQLLGLKDWNTDERLLHTVRLVNNNDLRLVEFMNENTGELTKGLTSLNLINKWISSYDKQLLNVIAETVAKETGNTAFVEWKSAYAMTVHKSQGSEWDKVAYFYHRKRWKNMQNNNLDYTAVTRARTDCLIIGFDK